MQLKSILCALHLLILATSILRSMQPLRSTMCYFCSWKYHQHIRTTLYVVSILESCTYAAPTLGVRILLTINLSTLHIHIENVLLLHWEGMPKNIHCHYVWFYLSNKAPVISVDTPYCYRCIKRDGWSLKKEKKKERGQKSQYKRKRKDSQVLVLRLRRYVIHKEQL